MPQANHYPPLLFTLVLAFCCSLFSPVQAGAFDLVKNLPNNSYIFPEASSSLAPQSGNTYSPGNAIDGNYLTAWVEGRPDNGIGEWLRLRFDGEVIPFVIDRIGIFNGYAKGERYWQNNRVKTATLVLSDGTRQVLRFQNIPEMQYFRINPTYTDSVTLIINEVYLGSKWRDTCISEIEVHVGR